MREDLMFSLRPGAGQRVLELGTKAQPLKTRSPKDPAKNKL